MLRLGSLLARSFAYGDSETESGTCDPGICKMSPRQNTDAHMMYVCVYVCVRMFVCVCMHVYLFCPRSYYCCICMCACMCLCGYVCVSAFIYVGGCGLVVWLFVCVVGCLWVCSSDRSFVRLFACLSWPLPCFVVVSALSSVSHDTQHRVCRCCVACLIGTALGDVSRMPVQLSVSPLRDQVLDVYLGKACERWQLLRPWSSSMCSRHHFSTRVCMQCRP
jgi:hypothetical protein